MLASPQLAPRSEGTAFNSFVNDCRATVARGEQHYTQEEVVVMQLHLLAVKLCRTAPMGMQACKAFLLCKLLPMVLSLSYPACHLQGALSRWASFTRHMSILRILHLQQRTIARAGARDQMNEWQKRAYSQCVLSAANHWGVMPHLVSKP